MYVDKYRTVFSPCMEYSNSDSVTVCPLCFVTYANTVYTTFVLTYMYAFILA